MFPLSESDSDITIDIALRKWGITKAFNYHQQLPLQYCQSCWIHYYMLLATTTISDTILFQLIIAKLTSQNKIYFSIPVIIYRVSILDLSPNSLNFLALSIYKNLAVPLVEDGITNILQYEIHTNKRLIS